jgi:hypothetical protein
VLLEHVEVLAEHDVGPHAAELVARGSRRIPVDRRQPALEQAVAPAEQQIAEEQGCRRAVRRGGAGPSAVGMQSLEPPVQARLAAAEVGVVHDVVVNEGGRVEDLERGRDRHDPVEARGCVGDGVEAVALGRHRLPAPVAEQRTEALPAGKEAACRRIQDVEVGRDLFEFAPALGEEGVDTVLDEID